MIKLMFLKVLILIRQVHHLSLVIFLDKGFKFQPSVCNGSHNVSMFMKPKSTVISNIRAGLTIVVLLMELAKVKP